MINDLAKYCSFDGAVAIDDERVTESPQFNVEPSTVQWKVSYKLSHGFNRVPKGQGSFHRPNSLSVPTDKSSRFNDVVRMEH